MYNTFIAGKRCVKATCIRNHKIPSIGTAQNSSVQKLQEAGSAAKGRFCNWCYEAFFRGEMDPLLTYFYVSDGFT